MSDWTFNTMTGEPERKEQMRPEMPTAHNHGNCELCDWMQARIEALEQVRFSAQSLVNAQIADGHSRRTAWANLRAALAANREAK